MVPRNSSRPTAMATVSQTGSQLARKKPNTMKRMSLTELMTLSP